VNDARTALQALLATLFLFAPAQRSAASEAELGEWAGTWHSLAGEVLNVTTLLADGRFRTEHLAGNRVAGATSGRWELRSGSISWSYDGPGGIADDVNPIVLKAADRFVLRELDGSESAFFRKGVVDPNSPPRLPVAVGAGWVLRDELGEFTIRVTTRETVGELDCYRVDWVQGPLAYQSEYWFVDAEGVHVAGRRQLGKRLVFARPYLLLKRALEPGDQWRAPVAVEGRELEATVSVGEPAELVTPAGSFRAVPVTLESDVLHYRRWYAENVGLVREDTYVLGELHNTKTLQRRLE